MIPNHQKVDDYHITKSGVLAYRQTQNDWYEDGHSVLRFVQGFDTKYQVSEYV